MSPNELTPAPKPARRLRGILYAGTLLIGGGVIGAVVVGPTLGQGQGPDGPRWQRGMSGDQQGQGEGRRWRRGGGDDQQAQGDGPRWRRGGGDGPQRFGEARRGGGMLFPGAIERRVNRILGAVDASTEQRQKVRAIFEAAATDLNPLRQKRMDNRKQIGAALAAATVDRAKIEALRGDQMKLADATSKRLTAALADAAEALTPEQRAELGRRMERMRQGRRG